MLSAAERDRFLERGYLVVPGVVPRELCDRVIEAICAFAGVDAGDPATWTGRPVHGHGIVPLHHDPALWAVRQHPAVYEVFRALYRTDALWVSMDRVSFKPPARDAEPPVRLSPVHWDADPRTFRGLGVQGLVYLADTDDSQGAFACAPGLYRRLPEWLAERPDDGRRPRPDVRDDELVRVGGPAGSLLVWHRLMPHTSARNDSDRARLVQYVAMRPAGTEAERATRVAEFEERRAPAWARRQNVAGQRDPEPYKPVALTPLGRRLVGLDAW